MSIAHHLDRATLMRFAAGTLDEAFNVVVAAHLELCAACQADLALAQETGGAMLEDMPASAMAPASLAETLERIGAEAQLGADQLDKMAAPGSGVVRVAPGGRAAPKALVPYVGEAWERAKWRRLAPGVAKCTLRTGPRSNGSLFLLRIGPGLAMPDHGHGGDEMTLILEGAYRDDFGEFKSGDIADLDEHDEHLPTVVSDVPCVCLVATERPTRFKGVVGRLLQPFLGI